MFNFSSSLLVPIDFYHVIFVSISFFFLLSFNLLLVDRIECILGFSDFEFGAPKSLYAGISFSFSESNLKLIRLLTDLFLREFRNKAFKFYMND